MNKIKKILTDLKYEYIRKRDCLIGTKKPDMKPETVDKIDYKIENYTHKIEEINDALTLELKDTK